MKIRSKILLGFLILATMLALAGAYSIFEFRLIGTSVQNLLDDNYRSITAAKTMIEALEREDSGLLLMLSGKWKEGRETIRSADGAFRGALETAGNNLTIDGELNYVNAIRNRYKTYARLWDRPVDGADQQGKLKWYLTEVHPRFMNVKTAVQSLMDLNDDAMYDTASVLKNRAHRAIMPGIIAILSALAFTIVFNFFINIYVVNPIISLKRAIDHFMETNEPVRVTVETRDEIHELAASVSDLTSMARISR